MVHNRGNVASTVSGLPSTFPADDVVGGPRLPINVMINDIPELDSNPRCFTQKARLFLVRRHHLNQLCGVTKLFFRVHNF